MSHKLDHGEASLVRIGLQLRHNLLLVVQEEERKILVAVPRLLDRLVSDERVGSSEPEAARVAVARLRQVGYVKRPVNLHRMRHHPLGGVQL